MDGLKLELDRADASYVPGEPIGGRASWDLPEPAGQVTVRLLWQTSGKGTEDLSVVGQEVIEMPGLRGEHAFSFSPVIGPYSFSGKLITLTWLVEVFTKRGNHHAEQVLTLSPTGEEVAL